MQTTPSRSIPELVKPAPWKAAEAGLAALSTGQPETPLQSMERMLRYNVIFQTEECGAGEFFSIPFWSATGRRHVSEIIANLRRNRPDLVVILNELPPQKAYVRWIGI